MKRIGIFSGKIYSQEDYDNDDIHECCLVLTSEEEKYTEDQMTELHIKLMQKCDGCYGCPASRKEVIM